MVMRCWLAIVRGANPVSGENAYRPFRCGREELTSAGFTARRRDSADAAPPGVGCR